MNPPNHQVLTNLESGSSTARHVLGSSSSASALPVNEQRRARVVPDDHRKGQNNVDSRPATHQLRASVSVSSEIAKSGGAGVTSGPISAAQLLGLPVRVVSVLHQMSSHSDRLTWTVAENAETVSVALDWNFVDQPLPQSTKQQPLPLCNDVETGGYRSGLSRHRASSAGSLNNGNQRRQQKQLHQNLDSAVSSAEVCSYDVDPLTFLDDLRLQKDRNVNGNGGLKIWRRLRAFVALRRLISSDDELSERQCQQNLRHQLTQLTDDIDYRKQPAANNVSSRDQTKRPSTSLTAKWRNRFRSRSVSAADRQASGNRNHFAANSSTANCDGFGVKMTSQTDAEVGRERRGSGGRVWARFRQLPVIRRWTGSTGRLTTVSSSSQRDASTADDVSVRLSGRKLFSSASFPDRIDRHGTSSTNAVHEQRPVFNGGRKYVAVDENISQERIDDVRELRYRTSNEMHNKLQLDLMSSNAGEMEARSQNSRISRQQKASRESTVAIMTSSSAVSQDQTTTPSVVWPQGRNVAPVKRSSWPRVFHPPSSADLFIDADRLTSPTDHPRRQVPMTTAPTRRYIRQPVSQQQNSLQQAVGDVISGSRGQLDFEDYIYNPHYQRAEWRRVRSGSRRSVGGRMSSGISCSTAETASVCSVGDVISSSTAFPVSGGARFMRHNSSLNIGVGRGDVIETLCHHRTAGATNSAAANSSFDCETVMRCLDSCDKILLRHSTTIT